MPHISPPNDLTLGALSGESQKQESREVATNTPINTPDHDASSEKRMAENGAGYLEIWLDFFLK